jgi:hypothetical protein
LPDARFYAALKRAVSPEQEIQTIHRLEAAQPRPTSAFAIKTILGGIISLAAVFLIGRFGFPAHAANSWATSTPANSITSTMTVQALIPTESVEPTRQHTAASTMIVQSTMTVDELEQLLHAANLVLSTGTPEETERVRSYFTGPDSAYHILSVGCLEILEDRRFMVTEHLDMIDKWYTILVGEENYISETGMLNLDMLQEAMVKAHNEIYGDNFHSLEQILEPKP